MSTAKQLIDALVHAGAVDDKKDADVLVETLDGDVLVTQAVNWDDDLNALVITTSRP